MKSFVTCSILLILLCFQFGYGDWRITTQPAKLIGGDGEIYQGYINNGVIVTLMTVSDSLNFILNCTNCWIERKNDYIENKEPIGILTNRIEKFDQPLDFPPCTTSIPDSISVPQEQLEILKNDPSSRMQTIGFSDTVGS